MKHRRFCTQKFLHTDAFTHRGFYTQKLLYTQTPLHTDTFSHRRFYTQTLSHTEVFTHRRPFSHRSFYTQELLHLHKHGRFQHGGMHRRFDAFTSNVLFVRKGRDGRVKLVPLSHCVLISFLGHDEASLLAFEALQGLPGAWPRHEDKARLTGTRMYNTIP